MRACIKQSKKKIRCAEPVYDPVYVDVCVCVCMVVRTKAISSMSRNVHTCTHTHTCKHTSKTSIPMLMIMCTHDCLILSGSMHLHTRHSVCTHAWGVYASYNSLFHARKIHRIIVPNHTRFVLVRACVHKSNNS
jgi:hypothetical protein